MRFEWMIRSGGAGLVAVTALLVMPPALGATPAPRYVAVPLGSLGGVQSEGRAINRNGDTTGLAFVRGDVAYHAFLGTADRMLDLGAPTGGSSVGTGINVHDEVVLNSSVHLSQPWPGHGMTNWYAYRYLNGSMQSVDTDGEAMVTGINDAGSIAGYTAFGIAFRGQVPPYEPLPGLGMSGGINTSGAVVGVAGMTGVLNVQHAGIVDAAGALHDLGSVGDWSSHGTAINDSGDATGSFFWRDPVTGVQHSHAFLYSAGRLTDLGALDAAYADTRGEGINSDDVVVGAATDPTTIQNRAFVYVDGQMYDLTSRVASGLGSAVLLDAAGVNDAGQIVATGCGPIGTCQAFRLDPVTSTPPPVAVPMIEYYEPAFDHYFMTSLPNEIEALDGGKFPGWTRTGQSFAVYPSAALGTERVCRFFNDQIAPSSHFYSADPNECLYTQNHPGWTWQLEGIVAYIAVPDLAGNCPIATVPVYRLYNNGKGGAPNHRYTTSASVRGQMLAQGWLPEGYGDGVAMCAPSQ